MVMNDFYKLSLLKLLIRFGDLQGKKDICFHFISTVLEEFIIEISLLRYYDKYAIITHTY